MWMLGVDGQLKYESRESREMNNNTNRGWVEVEKINCVNENINKQIKIFIAFSEENHLKQS